jgi:hypothetical protein
MSNRRDDPVEGSIVTFTRCDCRLEIFMKSLVISDFLRIKLRMILVRHVACIICEKFSRSFWLGNLLEGGYLLGMSVIRTVIMKWNLNW